MDRAVCTSGRSSIGLVSVVLGLATCAGDEGPAFDRIDEPSGMWVTPNEGQLVVLNGNWSERRSGAAAVVVDLDRVSAGIRDPLPAQAVRTRERPCRIRRGDVRVECASELVIDATLSVALPSGVGNVDWYEPGPGQVRLVFPSRIDPALNWLDVDLAQGRIRDLNCGASAGRCDLNFRDTSIANQPARLRIDRELGLAFLPHLLGGRATVFALDSSEPKVVNELDGLFRAAAFGEPDPAGGFAMAVRPCAGDDCGQRWVYASSRYFSGLHGLRIDAAPDGGTASAADLKPEIEQRLPSSFPLPRGRPVFGDLHFDQRPERGDQLYLLRLEPPSLIGLSISDQLTDLPVPIINGEVPLCVGPNLLVVGPSDVERPMAFASCFASARVAAIALDDLSLDREIPVGAQPNEMVLSLTRGWLLVANQGEHSVSIIDIDPTHESYLRELATIGDIRGRSGAVGQRSAWP